GRPPHCGTTQRGHRQPDRRGRRVLGRVPLCTRRRACTGACRTTSELVRRRPTRRTSAMIALVETAEGVVSVDLEDDTVLTVDAGAALETPPEVSVGLPRVIAAVASGSTVVCLVDTKPPLVVSHDAGRTWRESGRGLPPGRAIAATDDNRDLLLYP